MSKADEIKGKNFIIESIRAENCRDVSIFFFKDKTIEITEFTESKNIKYIDMKMLKKMYETSKELGWLDE